MKTKNYLVIMAILFVLLLYNILIYNFTNKKIYKETKNLIGDYFNTEKYEYLKATSNKDDSLNVFIRINDSYYRVVIPSNYSKIITVNKDIPAYIK